MFASTGIGKLARHFLIGFAIVGMLAATLGGLHQTRGFADASQAVSDAISGAASLALDDEDASATYCEIGRDLHYGYRVCSDLVNAYRYSGRVWVGKVYVYGYGWQVAKYYDYPYSNNIYIYRFY